MVLRSCDDTFIGVTRAQFFVSGAKWMGPRGKKTMRPREAPEVESGAGGSEAPSGPVKRFKAQPPPVLLQTSVKFVTDSFTLFFGLSQHVRETRNRFDALF